MSELICSNCGGKTKVSQKFCNNCGTPITKKGKNIEKDNGNWISKQSGAAKAIMGVIGICCIGISVLIIIGAMIPGGIQTDFNNASSIDNLSKKFSNDYYSFNYPNDAQIVNDSDLSSWITTINCHNGGTIEIWRSNSDQSLELETLDIITIIESNGKNNATKLGKIRVDGLEGDEIVAKYPSATVHYVLVRYNGELYEIKFYDSGITYKDMVLKSFKFNKLN